MPLSSIIIFSMFVFGSIGQAQTIDACRDFMPCGNYEGSVSWYDANNKLLSGPNEEQIIITRIDDKTVNLKVYIARGGQPKNLWTDAELTFDADGRFVMTAATSFGAGFCREHVCTVAFYPAKVSDQGSTYLNAFANILRFEGKTLKRFNMVSNSSDETQLLFQRSTLTLK